MELGQVALSKCGRDKEKYFIVVDIDDNKEFVYISDGDIRKIEKPKKKKIKHIIPLHIEETLNTKLVNGIKVTNSELKKCIRNISEQSTNINFDNSVSVNEGGWDLG